MLRHFEFSNEYKNSDINLAIRDNLYIVFEIFLSDFHKMIYRYISFFVLWIKILFLFLTLIFLYLWIL